MLDSNSERNPIDQLAEEFAERLRRGEHPALTDYVREYPELADEIRELFPALVMMEQFKPTSADAPDATSRRPERIGDYRLLREIGRGGMGVVYEAEQLSLGRHVALKVLSDDSLSNPTYLRRFRREAKAAARLHNTNIVPVFGVGEDEGVHYYAMQFIHGEGLDKVLRDLRRLRAGWGTATGGEATLDAVPSGSVAQNLLSGRFELPAPGETSGVSPPEAGLPPSSGTLSGTESEAEYCRSVARVGLQVADALAYAHKQGILHRDIKPSNLLLDLQGTVWVTDFGLAKAEDADELTHTGDIVGTVRYMAPERFEGASLPQSDVYALGMTLYEMLTLRPAFGESNRAKLIQSILHEDPPAPRKVDPRIPRDLETVVLKAVAHDPGRRYATAEDLGEESASLSDGSSGASAAQPAAGTILALVPAQSHRRQSYRGDRALADAGCHRRNNSPPATVGGCDPAGESLVRSGSMAAQADRRSPDHRHHPRAGRRRLQGNLHRGRNHGTLRMAYRGEGAGRFGPVGLYRSSSGSESHRSRSAWERRRHDRRRNHGAVLPRRRLGRPSALASPEVALRMRRTGR